MPSMTDFVQTYLPPTIILHREANELFQSEKLTALLWVRDIEDIDAIRALDSPKGTLWNAVVGDAHYGRVYPYTMILGIGTTIWKDYGFGDMSNVLQAIQDGKIFMDFYSSVLIPIVTFLVLVIVIISVIGLVRNILKDRTEMLAILRSVGLSSVGSGIYLTIELCVLCFLLAVVGLVVGMGCHLVIIAILDHVFEIRIATGFDAIRYVKAVTYNPYSMPLFVTMTGVLLSVLVAVWKLCRVSPIMIFQGDLEQGKKKRVRKNRKSRKAEKSWMPLLGDSIHLNDVTIMVMMIVVMSAAYFGYNYFRSLADSDMRAYEDELNANQMGNHDFLAEKNSGTVMFNLNTENHHDYGVEPDIFREYAGQEYIDTAYGVIINQSTRLQYPKDAGQGMYDRVLEKGNLRIHVPSEDDLDQTFYEGQEAHIRALGYEETEELYAAPTIGISRLLMEQLEGYVISGSLNWEQLQIGAEVVIAVPEGQADAVREAFLAGEELPLSDVVLSEEEDTYHFYSMELSELAEPILEKKTVDNGVEVNFTEYSFGHRKDIQTKIGAIVAVPENREAGEVQDWMQELTYAKLGQYPVLVLCAEEAFAAWELPDHLYMLVSAKVKDGYGVTQMDVAWYRMMSHASGMSSSSVSEIKAEMKSAGYKVMCIYYVMIILLMIVGMTAIGISLYSRIRMSSSQIASLRAIGMSLSQLTKWIIRQNMCYPLIGAVCALVPVSMCECLFHYIIYQINKGDWFSSGLIKYREPWYLQLPYWYSLFSHHPILTLLVITAIMMGLIVLVTLPQIAYIRRQRIVEDLEKVSF